MKVLITTALWGRSYLDLFLNFGLPSLFNINNTCYNKSVKIDCLILTTRFNNLKISRHINKNLNYQNINFIFKNFEEFGISEFSLPHKYETNKYKFLNACQNYFINYSITEKYDYQIINYPDFIWAENSINYLFKNFQNKNFSAYFCFCLPVKKKLIQFLKKDLYFNLNLKNFKNLVLKNLHDEVIIRNWERECISTYPSYFYWNVEEEGILIRTFHKHLVAFKVEDKSVYRNGINHGTLDGNFVLEIEKKFQTMTFYNQVNFCLISVYDTNASSISLYRKNKKDMIEDFIANNCTDLHFKNFQKPIYFSKLDEINLDLWKRIERNSLDIFNKEIRLNISQNNKVKNKTKYKLENFKSNRKKIIISSLTKFISFLKHVLKIYIKFMIIKSLSQYRN